MCVINNFSKAEAKRAYVRNLQKGTDQFKESYTELKPKPNWKSSRSTLLDIPCQKWFIPFMIRKHMTLNIYALVVISGTNLIICL